MLTAFLPFDSTLLLLVSFLSALLPQVLERYPPHVRKDTPGQKCLSPQTPRKCSERNCFAVLTYTLRVIRPQGATAQCVEHQNSTAKLSAAPRDNVATSTLRMGRLAVQVLLNVP